LLDVTLERRELDRPPALDLLHPTAQLTEGLETEAENRDA
jgi:hypothetical protein